MEANKTYLEKMFSSDIRFEIPVFQRNYVWDKEHQWQPLWEDINEKLENRIKKANTFPHYTGTIVLSEKSGLTTNQPKTYLVIDGQQRLVTFSLLGAAVRETCHEHDFPELADCVSGLLLNRNVELMDNPETEQYKLWPTSYNLDIYKDAISLRYRDVFSKYAKHLLRKKGVGRKNYANKLRKDSKILGVYFFFYEKIKELLSDASKEKVELLLKNLIKTIHNDFQFVEILLSEGDNPQIIFETLNGRGTPLSSADLIRNFIFMRAEKNNEDIQACYDNHWSFFEDDFWLRKIKHGNLRNQRIDFFFRDFLLYKTVRDMRFEQLFDRYKLWVVNNPNEYPNISGELEDLTIKARIYGKFDKIDSATGYLKVLLKRLRSLNLTAIFPFLLFIESEQDDIEEKEKIYRIIDSYVVRRSICEYTAKAYNRISFRFIKHFKESGITARALEKYLASKTGDVSVWPDDNTFKESWIENIVYNKLRYVPFLVSVLYEIEKKLHSRKQESINIDISELTIEHILPRNWWKNWPLQDSKKVTEEDYISIRDNPYRILKEENENGYLHQIKKRNELLDSFGNLTLVTQPLNSSVRNGPFTRKKEEICKQSVLMLNHYFQDKEEWDEKAIRKRAEELFKIAKQIWPYFQGFQ